MPGKPTNDPVNYIAIGKQADKDTTATTFYFLKHLDGSGFEVEQEIQSEREGGDGQEVGLRYKSSIRANGALVANARPEAAGRLFAYALGSDSSATKVMGATNWFTHTAAPVASQPYLTINQRWSDEIERADANVINQLTLEGEAGRPIRLNVTYFCGGSIVQMDTGSTLTPVGESGLPWLYPAGSYAFDGAASYARKVTKFKIEINRGLDDNIQTVGLNLEDVVPLNFDVSFDATIKYESRDFYRKVQYDPTGSQILLNLPTGSFEAVVLGGQGSQHLRVVLPLLNWTDARVNKLDPDGKTVYMDVVGMTLKASTHSIFTAVDTADAAAY